MTITGRKWILVKRGTAAIIVAVALLLGTMAAGASTITFWHGGFHQDTLDWLEREVYPAFEEKYGVTVEHRTIGWGPARTDQLVVAMAAGVGPDVLMLGANYHVMENAMLIPLDRFIDTWEDRHQIIEPLWENVRYQGQTWGVPHHGEIRGIAYHASVLAEVGIGDRPPESWEEWLDYVRTLTRVDETRVVRQGMEWPWSEIEYRWLVLQNGSEVFDEERLTSRLNEDEALEALAFFKELRDAARPPGFAARPWQDFAKGDVAMAWGIPFSLRLAHDEGPDVGDQVRVYAPRRSPGHDPVTLGFINSLAITNQASDPQLAWDFIKFMMGYEVTEELLNQGFEYMVLRTDVIQSRSEHILPFMPLYDLMHQSVGGIAAPFTSDLRTQLRNQLNLMFADRIPVEQARDEMHRIFNQYLANESR